MGALHSKLVLFYQVLSACTISTRASSAGIRLKRRMLVLRLTSNTVARCRCRPRRTVSAPKVFDSPLHLFSSFRFPPPDCPGSSFLGSSLYAAGGYFNTQFSLGLIGPTGYLLLQKMEQPAMSWPEQLHENNLISAPGEEEFSNLFDFNIPFPEIEHGPGTGNMQHSHSLPTSTGPDSDMAHLRSHGMQYSGQMEGLMDFNDNAQSHTNHGNSMPYSTPHMTPGFCAQQPSPMSQPPTHQHYMQGHNMIPPTPNSIEMHGNTARYPHRVDETDMYDGYSRMNEEQVSLDTNPRMNLLANNQGPLHSSYLTGYDAPGEPIPTPRIHNPRRILYTSHLSRPRGPKLRIQQLPVPRKTGFGHGLRSHNYGSEPSPWKLGSTFS